MRLTAFASVFAIVLAAVSVTTLAGCGSKPPLPPPGTRGGALFQMWMEGGGEPHQALAEEVRPNSIRFDDLDLRKVVIRIAIDAKNGGGVLCIRSPQAFWHQRGNNGEGGRLELVGPVHLAGIQGGGPLLGRADSARLDRVSQTLVFENLEYVHLGTITFATHAISQRTDFRDDRSRSGTSQDRARWIRLRGPSSRSSDPPPAMTAALAALPTGVILPDLRITAQP